MRVSPRYHLIKIALVLIWAQGVLAKRRNYQCPLGFEIAFTDDGSPICYRQKGPEAFNDKFVNCAGNLFSSKLYHSLNFTKTKQIVWTEYKSLYPGGPYIDWSYTDSTGDVLRSTFDVNYDSSLGIDDELCVVVDPVSNFTAASCDGKFYRYCFVKPYDEDDKSRKGCTSLGDSYRFYSPVSTCLSAVTGVGGGTVRATWRQATELCSKRGGSLLNRGWRYSNNPLLHVSGSLPVYPLGLVMSSNLTTLRYDTLDDMSEIPPAEWMFDNVNSTTSHIDSIYGAVANNFWRLVNNSFLFYDVICEHQHPLTALNMILTVDEDSKIVLSVNDSIKKNDIHCFTDSMIYYPTEVSISKGDDDHTFRVIPAFDGYYWCIQMNHKKYMPSESNKALFIISKESLVNLYACKIRLKKEYRFDNLDKLNRVWKKKLDEYIYYKTKYEAIYGTLESNQTEQVLQKFKGEHPELDWKDSDVIYGLKIKRLYVDARSALVHIMLNPEMSPVPPGIWDHIELIYMKPAYYCKGFDSIPTSELGASVTSAGCRTYTCVGDFNEGVQWVETSTSSCATNPTVMIRTDDVNYPESTRTQVTKVEPSIGEVPSKEPDNTSSDESFENTTTASTTTKASTIATSTTPCLIIETTESSWPTTTESSWPTTTDATPIDEVTLFPVTIVPWTTTQPTTTTEPIPPEEQLQQVLGELELLLKNDTVSIENIERPFDQVNDILYGEDDDLEIPGQLLHLLDELAFRVKLTDSQAITVRDNVALLMADVTPENPIRGVRMAARDYDAFSNNSFGFIDGNLDASQLLTNASEAVVYLPASVSAAARRVSFVAFRNQRAFQSTLPVNSRVFSVNVENLTTFENGEVIDIHLTPIVDEPGRNQSRACAYWHFEGNNSGYWSQDGCTLIRATVPGTMDTCRCTHLTHFAEVLVPRTVFSEVNEQTLEILSIIGCAVSMFGLIMIAITATLFRSWRRDYSNKIWLQLCAAIFLSIVCFIIVVFTKFDRYNVACMLVGVLLHYSVVASFCWMLVAAVLSYRRLVLVFTRDMSHKLLRASAFAWGFPCAVVGILLSVDPQSYQGRFEDKTPSGAFCYPSGLGLWLAVYAPIVIMLLANWVLFILIVRSVFASRRIQRHGDSNEALRCATVSCLLVFLFGLPWIFGIFAFNVVAAYFFTLTSTYQGFVLFVFFVLGNKKTRDLWLNKLKIKQTRKIPVTSSTYTNNRSTGPGWRGGAEGGSSIEAKTSKPRSLTSPDDSRFS